MVLGIIIFFVNKALALSIFFDKIRFYDWLNDVNVLINFFLMITFFMGIFLTLSRLIGLRFKVKIFILFTKMKNRREGQLFEAFFDKYFESLDASLLEACFYDLGVTR